MELLARFATGEELKEFQGKNYKPLGDSNVYVPPVSLRTEETITFQLSHFLWNSMIDMKGIRAASI
ncbi:MAG: hypothetical protein RSD55_01990 [Lachnospiraceae bacterium]